MNHLIFNNKQYPLYEVSSSMGEAARAGDAYINRTIVGNNFNITNEEGGVMLYVSNPSSSRKRLIIKDIMFANLGVPVPRVLIMKGPGVSGGYIVTAINTNLGSTKTTVAFCRYVTREDGSPLGGGQWTVIETATQVSSGFSISFKNAFIVLPENTICIRFIGTVGTRVKVDAAMMYWEEDL